MLGVAITCPSQALSTHRNMWVKKLWHFQLQCCPTICQSCRDDFSSELVLSLILPRQGQVKQSKLLLVNIYGLERSTVVPPQWPWSNADHGEWLDQRPPETIAFYHFLVHKPFSSKGYYDTVGRIYSCWHWYFLGELQWATNSTC